MNDKKLIEILNYCYKIDAENYIELLPKIMQIIPLIIDTDIAIYITEKYYEYTENIIYIDSFEHKNMKKFHIKLPIYDHTIIIDILFLFDEIYLYSPLFKKLYKDISKYDLSISLLRFIFILSIIRHSFYIDDEDIPDNAFDLIKNIIYLNTKNKEFSKNEAKSIIQNSI